MKKTSLLVTALVMVCGAAIAEEQPYTCLDVVAGPSVSVGTPPEPELVCEVALGAGSHELGLGWSPGSSLVLGLQIATAEPALSMGCSVLAGLGNCDVDAAIPHDWSYWAAAPGLPARLLGQVTLAFTLSEPGTLRLYTGIINHVAVCPTECAMVSNGLGVVQVEGV